MTAVVETWDDAAGVGTLRTDEGALLDLQCTNLADGSRTTEVGVRVDANATPGHHGRMQAVDVRSASGP